MKLWKDDKFPGKLAQIEYWKKIERNYTYQNTRLGPTYWIFKLWTRRKEGLLFATIFGAHTGVGIISKCEGVHFYTKLDISKLVELDHKFTKIHG